MARLPAAARVCVCLCASAQCREHEHGGKRSEPDPGSDLLAKANGCLFPRWTARGNLRQLSVDPGQFFGRALISALGLGTTNPAQKAG